MRPVWSKTVKRLLEDSRGFTLVEVLVAVGLLIIVAGLVSSSTFQILSVQRTWQDDVLATQELRQAEGWFARDSLTAVTTTIPHLGPSTTTASMMWSDILDVNYTSTYSLSGMTLFRDLDSSAATSTRIEVAREVATVNFSRSGRLVTFDLSVEAAEGQTATSSLNTYLRYAQ